jgi:hypothetical protein
MGGFYELLALVHIGEYSAICGEWQGGLFVLFVGFVVNLLTLYRSCISFLFSLL